jgi:hypothetical protein
VGKREKKLLDLVLGTLEGLLHGGLLGGRLKMEEDDEVLKVGWDDEEEEEG